MFLGYEAVCVINCHLAIQKVSILFIAFWAGRYNALLRGQLSQHERCGQTPFVRCFPAFHHSKLEYGVAMRAEGRVRCQTF